MTSFSDREDSVGFTGSFSERVPSMTFAMCPVPEKAGEIVRVFKGMGKEYEGHGLSRLELKKQRLEPPSVVAE